MLLYCERCRYFTFSSYFYNPCEDSWFFFFSGGVGRYNIPSNTAAIGVANQGNNGGMAYNSFPYVAGGGGGAAGAGVAGTASEGLFIVTKNFTQLL